MERNETRRKEKEKSKAKRASQERPQIAEEMTRDDMQQCCE